MKKTVITLLLVCIMLFGSPQIQADTAPAPLPPSDSAVVIIFKAILDVINPLSIAKNALKGFLDNLPSLSPAEQQRQLDEINKQIEEAGSAANAPVPTSSPLSYSGTPPDGGRFNYVCQKDVKLNQSDKTGGCIESSGCAVMSANMALQNVARFYKIPAEIDLNNPLTIYDYYVKHGWSHCGLATGWGWKDWMVNDLGIKSVAIELVENGIFNLEKASYYTQHGCTIIGSSKGHVFVVDSIVDVHNKLISVRDPWTCDPQTGKEDDTRIRQVIDPRFPYTYVNFYAHPVCAPDVPILP